MSFDSITNRGEFFSSHYLDAIIGGDLGDLRRKWDEQEKGHQDTARSRLKALAKPFFAARADVTESTNDANSRRATETLNGHVLRALGLEVGRQPLTLSHTTIDELQVPVAATVETGSGLHLIALEAGLADDVDDLFATGAGEQGRLLDPVHKVGEKLDVLDPADAVSALFALDDPPRWVLVVAGRVVLLAERARWAEGRFLAVDLDTALERNDTSAKGEIETIAALFSTDALLPHDGQAVIDELADKSTKHAVGVSKELREGIRQSIELLANEVIQRRLDKNLGVYSGDNRIDPRDLTTQCLRYLYRLLVLLYAESRPELGIVPVDDEVYIAGYSLDRLRELTLTELDTDKARRGTHLDQSLRSLFELVNEGYHAENVAVGMVFGDDHDDPEASYEDYLQFPGLDAQLFDPSAVPLIDSVTLRNEPLQKVLQLLMLSPEGKGKRADRGFISYAQLGINQLGAVYEGLMAYTGFFADTDMYEVAKNGDPSDGTWVLPVEKADEYREDVFVTREDPLTGATARVLHPKGSFVFRLSGRDRQRSASYYTPEVLTRCVVKHALAELLGTDDYAPENGSSGITEARQILDLTICEPALGSGAFLNEAINQLSAEYLKRRQAELGEALDPEQYNRELQKVKAHFALHQSYGVDLNATAIELAEVSLWLNCMHPGLMAPWFGMQLRRGNSLVGCRRATWKVSQLKDKPWAKTKRDDLQSPVERALTEPLAGDEIHHFLLPGHGWAAVADRDEAKELRPKETRALTEWRTTILKAPRIKDAERLLALAAGVERLWAAATERLKLAQRSLRRPIEVWGAGKIATTNPADRRKITEALEHPDSELSRLRLVMDAWVGLWFWELDAAVDPPTWTQWLAALEDLIGPKAPLPSEGQLDLFDDLDRLIQADEESNDDRASTASVVAAHPWLGSARTLACIQGAFHWSLEAAQVFAAGGFDLQVGNPPWVKFEWVADVELAEIDSRLAVVELGARQKDTIRQGALATDAGEGQFIDGLTRYSGMASYLGSPVLHWRLVGLQNNLYLSFIDACWRLGAPWGVQGLIHQESFLTDPSGGPLRAPYYRRVRRRAHFRNELRLFEDVKNNTPYCVAVYGPDEVVPSFIQAGWLLSPTTWDDSFHHDGGGELPGVKTPSGAWDLRPHARRLARRGFDQLAADAAFYGDADVASTRCLTAVLLDDLDVVAAVVESGNRLGDSGDYLYGRGFEPKVAIGAGAIVDEQVRPNDVAALVPMAGHLAPALPYAQEPHQPFRSNRDYDAIDLEGLSADFIPRSNYRIVDRDRALALIGDAGVERPRLAWRRRLDPSGERILQAALLPVGALTTHSVATVSTADRRGVVVMAALWASIPVEFMVRMTGKEDLQENLARLMPGPMHSPLVSAAGLRILRLNCITSSLEDYWRENFVDTWLVDRWTQMTRQQVLGDVGPEWTPATPLRSDQDRRLALVELDAIAAAMLGLTAAQLCAVYRTQFPVLRKYEYSMAFDAQGRKICKHHQSAGYRQSQLQQQARDGQLRKDWKNVWKLYEQWEEDPDSVEWMGHFKPPFYRPDREAEMTAAYNEFQRRLETGFYSAVSEGASA